MTFKDDIEKKIKMIKGRIQFLRENRSGVERKLYLIFFLRPASYFMPTVGSKKRKRFSKIRNVQVITT